MLMTGETLDEVSRLDLLSIGRGFLVSIADSFEEMVDPYNTRVRC